jgi:biotin carboxyl carrier protein
MERAQWKMDSKDLVTAGEGVSLSWEDATFFNLEYNGRVFHGEVLSNRIEEGKLTVKLNHRVFELSKSGPLDDLIASLGLDKPKVRKLRQLKAPMPGRVIGISVETGTEVKPGDPLITLEAMKMENVLKAEGVGTVKAILVSPQDVLEKGALMIEFE